LKQPRNPRVLGSSFKRACPFALFISFSKWPERGMSFNMWVNLPMFDPTVGSDVVNSLKCDARRNIIWSLGLPLILSPSLGRAVFTDRRHPSPWWALRGLVCDPTGDFPICPLIWVTALLRLRCMIRSYQKRIISALTPGERLALS
jgi:hypothetical protein